MKFVPINAVNWAWIDFRFNYSNHRSRIVADQNFNTFFAAAFLPINDGELFINNHSILGKNDATFGLNASLEIETARILFWFLPLRLIPTITTNNNNKKDYASLFQAQTEWICAWGSSIKSRYLAFSWLQFAKERFFV